MVRLLGFASCFLECTYFIEEEKEREWSEKGLRDEIGCAGAVNEM